MVTRYLYAQNILTLISIINMISILKQFARHIWGSNYAREYHKIELKIFYDQLNSFNYLVNFSDLTTETEADLLYKPIFIFSAGWRSGSTLVQRLLCSDPNVLVWGEPYDKSNLIQCLAESILPITKNWPPHNFFISNVKKEDLSYLWIANLYPNLNDYLNSHRQFILNLFANTAKAEGFSRWGIKEVRYGLSEALYLKILFPQGKFIFLHRELLPAYKSYSSFSKHKLWYSKWPTGAAFSPYTFAKHRAKLVSEHGKALRIIGGIDIKYEDIISDNFDLKALEKYCELEIDKNIIKKKVGSRKKSDSEYQVSIFEKLLLSIGNKSGK